MAEQKKVSIAQASRLFGKNEMNGAVLNSSLETGEPWMAMRVYTGSRRPRTLRVAKESFDRG